LTIDSGRQEGLPRQLGRYVLLSRLTEGGMTEVYAARLANEVGPGRMLVIKVLPKSVAADPEAESRFLSEARIVLNLTHGNITTAFEFGRDENGRPFLVMEYVPGPSLRRLLSALQQKGGALPIADGLFIVAEVAKALSYAHGVRVPSENATGIVHRDISPDNIVISTSGQVKLTDFGIAHFARAQTFGPIFGKPAYIAPEVAAGASPSVVSDIYSTGAVLYECLTGVPPFKGKNDKETLRRLAEETAQPLAVHRPEVPERLESLMTSLLEKDPDVRLARAGQMEVTLRGFLRENHPAYTESHLAETIGAHFSLADFMDPTPRESLIQELMDAGMALSGEESTDELLENRTIPIDGDDKGPTAADARRNRFGRRGVFPALIFGVPLIAMVALALLVRPFGEQPIPRVDDPGDEITPAKAEIIHDEPKTPATLETGPSHALKIENVVEEAFPKSTAQKGRPHAVKKRKSDEETASVRGTGSAEASAEWGWLNINSYPWSYVTVDGKKLNGHTPYRRIRLKSGPHQLVFENPELKLRLEKRVVVVSWEETNIGVRLTGGE
jgi:serine/threonine protein kinase